MSPSDSARVAPTQKRIKIFLFRITLVITVVIACTSRINYPTFIFVCEFVLKIVRCSNWIDVTLNSFSWVRKKDRHIKKISYALVSDDIVRKSNEHFVIQILPPKKYKTSSKRTVIILEGNA